MTDDQTLKGCQSCGQVSSSTRCTTCTKKARQLRKARVKARQEILAANPGIRPHGDASTYSSWGCRCEACTHAATVDRYRFARKKRGGVLTVRSTPTTTQPFGREWLDAP